MRSTQTLTIPIPAIHDLRMNRYQVTIEGFADLGPRWGESEALLLANLPGKFKDSNRKIILGLDEPGAARSLWRYANRRPKFLMNLPPEN